MDKTLTKVAGVAGTVVGFLNHHVADLNAVATALQGIVAALPVNAETRASINQAITRVTTSADNIVASLSSLDALEKPTFHIAESDLAKVLSDDEGKAVISQMIADYLKAHPQVGDTPAQVDQGAATAAERGDLMQAGDRQGAQQMGEEARQASGEPQDGTNRQEDAPAPSQPTAAQKGAAAKAGK